MHQPLFFDSISNFYRDDNVDLSRWLPYQIMALRSGIGLISVILSHQIILLRTLHTNFNCPDLHLVHNHNHEGFQYRKIRSK